MRLGDLDCPDRGRKVGPGAHPIPDLVKVSLQIGLELVQILPVHSRGTLVLLDVPPRLPHHQLGNYKRLVFGLRHVFSLPPRTQGPRLIETTFLVSRPLRSTPTPASGDFSATTGRSASERRVGTQCLRFLPRHAPSSDLWGLRPRTPYRRSPSHVPCKSRRPGSRRLYAGHRLAGNAGTRQAHLEGRSRTPDFDAISDFRRLNDDAPPGLPSRALLERLPGPHLTGSSPAFSLYAHHDSRQLTQLQGGLTPSPAGPTPEGRRSSISRTAPLSRVPYMDPPSAFVTHTPRHLGVNRGLVGLWC